MYATNHFEEIMLNLARGISASAPETMYLALYLNDPGDDGAGTEVSYPGMPGSPSPSRRLPHPAMGTQCRIRPHSPLQNHPYPLATSPMSL